MSKQQLPPLTFGPKRDNDNKTNNSKPAESSEPKIEPKEEPAKEKPIVKPASKKSKSVKKGRHTYYHSTENNTFIERVKYWDRVSSQGDVIDAALDMYREFKEKQGAIYLPTPDEEKE